MMKIRFFLWLLALACLAPSWAWAEDVSVSDAWVRVATGDGPLAGYLVIHNNSDKPLLLRGASSPDFGHVMLHQSRVEGGQATMQAVSEGVRIAPGAKLALQPGGYHLMLMHRRRALAPGDNVEIELAFARHDPLLVRLAVKPVWYQP